MLEIADSYNCKYWSYSTYKYIQCTEQYWGELNHKGTLGLQALQHHLYWMMFSWLSYATKPGGKRNSRTWAQGLYAFSTLHTPAKHCTQAAYHAWSCACPVWVSQYRTHRHTNNCCAERNNHLSSSVTFLANHCLSRNAVVEKSSHMDLNVVKLVQEIQCNSMEQLGMFIVKPQTLLVKQFWKTPYMSI